MPEIINFREKRKALARKNKERKAQQNRVKFGRSKESRRKDAQENEIAEKIWQSHALTDQSSGKDDFEPGSN